MLALRKEIKDPLVSTSQGYCSTNLLTQEVSQHIALFDAQLHGTLRDSSLRAPVQGDRRERCVDRFPKFLSGLNEPVQLFLLTVNFFSTTIQGRVIHFSPPMSGGFAGVRLAFSVILR